MDWNVALDVDHHTLIEGGTKAESEIIYIPPGKVALLSMYNMLSTIDYEDGVLSSNDCGEIQKISFGATPEISSIMDCGTQRNIPRELLASVKNRRVFKETVTQRGNCWTIDPTSNFVMIPTPGYYSIILYDVDQIDSAYVEYIILDVADAKAVPEQLKLGSGSYCQ